MAARTIYFIKRLETEAAVQMTRILGVYDMTPAQYIVLSFVGDSEMDLSSAQLSRRFLMTPQSMNEVVTTLQRKELIEKNIDPNHKRILRIRLTAKGKDMLDMCNTEVDIFEADFFAPLNVEELSSFRQFMGKILETGHSKEL